MSPNVYFLKLLLEQGLPTLQQAHASLNQISGEYFLLVDTLIKESPSLHGIETSDVAKTLSRAIRTSVVVERTKTDSDPMLNGLMTCLTSLLAKDGSAIGTLLKVEVGIRQGLVSFLLNKGLFDAPSSMTSKKHLQPPLCKSKQLRTTTFELLLELCRSCDDNVSEVAKCCSPRHVLNDPDIVSGHGHQGRNGSSNGSNNVGNVIGTSGNSSAGSNVSYMNYNGSKSITGFVGLRNLCCTCYMNATNQNLFMVKAWRNAVLAIDIDTGDTNAESMIYQTQRMYAYLQESEKQYYDPKGFCHTYKDPDDPSKPIDPRVQQDASAYYGRLLHR